MFKKVFLVFLFTILVVVIYNRWYYELFLAACLIGILFVFKRALDPAETFDDVRKTRALFGLKTSTILMRAFYLIGGIFSILIYISELIEYFEKSR